jgi:hypothetical protein
MRRIVFGAALVAAALGLGGCAGGGFAGYERGVTGGGGGLPVTVARARSDVVTPPGRRQLGLAVRTFERDAAGGSVEVAGECAIRAGAFRASTATPGRLVIPDLGPDAPGIVAECRRGAARGSASAAPVFAWEESGGTGLERLLWGGGPWRGGVRTGPMRYPDLLVGLN